MYSHSTRGTEITVTEGQWLLSKLPECSSPKTPDNSLEAHACSPYIPLTLHISLMFVTSLNNVRIVFFPLLVGKPCAYAGEPCWLGCTPAGIPPACSSTAVHGPSHQFHIPNSKPVTFTPRYSGAPLYQSLKFIKITC